MKDTHIQDGATTLHGLYTWNVLLYTLPSLLEGTKDKSSETMAATSRMMRVTSCSASHTNRQKVFGGLGGIVLEPNVCRRCSMSFGEPDNPVR